MSRFHSTPPSSFSASPSSDLREDSAAERLSMHGSLGESSQRAAFPSSSGPRSACYSGSHSSTRRRSSRGSYSETDREEDERLFADRMVYDGQQQQHSNEDESDGEEEGFLQASSSLDRNTASDTRERRESQGSHHREAVRPGKKKLRQDGHGHMGKRLSGRKGKGRVGAGAGAGGIDDDEEDENDDEGDGDGYGSIENRISLLDLPNDILSPILSLLSPQQLLRTRLVCRRFDRILADDRLWRSAYIHTYTSPDTPAAIAHSGGSNAARHRRDGISSRRDGESDGDGEAEELAKLGPQTDREGPKTHTNSDPSRVLGIIRSCVGNGQGGGGYGWKKEALAREAMMFRFLDSRAPTIVCNPHIDVITSIALLHLPPTNHHPPSRNTSSPALPSLGTHSSSPSPSPVRVLGAKNRQPHRQLNGNSSIAGRAPNILSLGLNVGVCARTDPLIGKTMQGHLGPGQVSALNEFDRIPTCAYISPPRNPSSVVWGLRSGFVVYSQVLDPMPTPGRLTGTTIACDRNDRHTAPVRSVWAVDNWIVSGGEDGFVKLWKVEMDTRTGFPKSLGCSWTSQRLQYSVGSDLFRPSAIHAVRFDPQHNKRILAATSSQLWLLQEGQAGRCLYEWSRSSNEDSPIAAMHVETTQEEENIVVFLHIKGEPGFLKITASGEASDTNEEIRVLSFLTPSPAPLTTTFVDLSRPAPLAQPVSLIPADFSARLISPRETPSATPVYSASETPRSESTTQRSSIGNQPFVAAGTADGKVHVWMWDTDVKERKAGKVWPCRSWDADEGAITAITSARGLVATGSFDGSIKIWDPLPTACSPGSRLLRVLRDRHLNPPSIIPAAETHAASYYSVNDIVLESDMVIAAIGSRVLGWRAGDKRLKESSKVWRGQVIGGHRHGSGGGGSGGKSTPTKGYDGNEIREDVRQTWEEVQVEQAQARERLQRDRRAQEYYDELGLESTDEALQLAIMMSQEEEGRRTERMADAEYNPTELLAANQAEFEDGERAELAEALRAIELMESRQGKKRNDDLDHSQSTVYSGGSTRDSAQPHCGMENSQAQEDGVSAKISREPDDVDDLELAEILAQIQAAEEREQQAKADEWGSGSGTLERSPYTTVNSVDLSSASHSHQSGQVPTSDPGHHEDHPNGEGEEDLQDILRQIEEAERRERESRRGW